MQISRAQIETFLKQPNPYRQAGDESLYWVGICHVRLGHHDQANRLFQAALPAMLGECPHWWSIAAPDLFVNSFLLSARTDLLPQVQGVLAAYRDQDDHYRGYSPLACYAYALLEALSPTGADVEWYVEQAMSRPKFREAYFAGQAVNAILRRDQAALDEALHETIRVYERQVKQGGLRLAGLPFKILAADTMALAYVAHRQGLEAAPASDYFAADYLEFIEMDR